MKLKHVFSFASTRLDDAIRDNNVQELEKLRRKKDSFLFGAMFSENLAKLTPEMADKFISFTDQDWQKWGCKPDSRDMIMGSLLCMAVAEGRADLFGRYMNSGASFNNGEAEQHPIHYLLEGKLTQAEKAEFTGRLLREGIDKVEKAETLLKDAAVHGCPGAFDLLAAVFGDGLHKNNEELLRAAAKAGQKEMCTHLVEKHNCNIDLAITTGKTLGQQDTWPFLEALRADLKPGETAPPTIESLAAELTELKATVRAMALQLAERDRERQIDKPALAAPSLKAG